MEEEYAASILMVEARGEDAVKHLADYKQWKGYGTRSGTTGTVLMNCKNTEHSPPRKPENLQLKVTLRK
jgi:hypothetical protein